MVVKSPARKLIKAIPVGYMTIGEKMIWAAAYAGEYRRWISSEDGRQWEPWQAAKFAIDAATSATLAARWAVSNSHLENSVHQAYLRNMVATGRKQR